MKHIFAFMLMLLSFGAYSQTLTGVYYPQYMQGVGTSNASDDRKVPYACRMTVAGLTPNATYRYYNRFVTDPASTSNGQGNYTIATQAGSFFRVTSASLATAGRYGEFTTDAAGSYTGWFISEASIATDFAPGTTLYFRLMLNNGAGGGTVATRVTAADPVTVINWGSAANQGSGLRTPANTDFAEKNFVMFFESAGASGRPVAGTFVESDGVLNDANPSYYVPFYATDVDGQAGAWGTIIPNNLSNGVNNISQYSLSSGALVNSCTSTNGTFGTTATAGMTNGLNPLVLSCSPAAPCQLTITNAVTNVGCAGGTNGAINLTVSGGTGPYTYSWSNGATTEDLTGLAAGTYTVSVSDAAGTCNGSASVTVSQPAVLTASATAGTIAFCGGTTTIVVSAAGGTAPYTGVGSFLSSGGAYSFTVRDANGCTTVVSGTIALPTCATLSPVLYPQYVQGVGSSVASDDRKVPFAARMTIAGLQSNATYRYYPRFVQDPATQLNGAGNYIIANQSGDFTRVTSASLTTAGRYGEFTADASGNYTGWFIVEPSLATDFQPGTQLYLRVNLNNGAGGGSVAQRVTATSPVTVLGFGSNPTDGTGLRSNAVAAYEAKNFIMVYTDAAASGRPVAGTFVESDGTVNTVTEGYAPFYADNVDGQAKTWGTIIPNNLPNGVNNISQYSLANGALVNACTATAGNFGGTATANANGGLNALAITCTPAGACTLDPVASTVMVSCNGLSDGSIDITVNGGTAPFVYSWSNGATTEDLSGLAAGTYTLTVTDGGGCSATEIVVITQPAAVTAPTIQVTNNGNGTYTLTAGNFTGALLWSNGAITTAITVSAAGTYSVSQTIGTCAGPAASVTISSDVTADPATGNIDITNMSGVSVPANSLLFSTIYQIKVPVYNLNQFTPLPSGSTKLIVDLGNRLVLDPSFNLAAAPLNQYFAWTSAVVGGKVIITGDQIAEIPADFFSVAVFQVTGSLSCTSTINTDFDVTNHNTGTMLIDEDPNNNTAYLQYNLPVTVSATAVNVTCNGAANGNITVVASPGTTIVITNASGNVVTAPLAPGTYTVTANATGDAPASNSCSNSTTVTITEPPVLVNSLVSTTPSICNGGNTGSLTVSATGGTAPYTYTIAGPTVNTTGATTGVFTGLTAGAYVVTATDVNGCTAMVNVTVTQPTGTQPDISLGSDIDGTLFTASTTTHTVVYNVAEIAGNEAVGDTIRITRVAGYTINFDPSASSATVGGTTYALDNQRWVIDNSNTAFVSIILTNPANPGAPGVLNCGERVNVSITITRNTTNVAGFALSARLRRANGEINLSNNLNSIMLAAD